MAAECLQRMLSTRGDDVREHITEIDGSHVIIISQPQAVTDVILTALKAVS